KGSKGSQFGLRDSIPSNCSVRGGDTHDGKLIGALAEHSKGMSEWIAEVLIEDVGNRGPLCGGRLRVERLYEFLEGFSAANRVHFALVIRSLKDGGPEKRDRDPAEQIADDRRGGEVAAVDKSLGLKREAQHRP